MYHTTQASRHGLTVALSCERRGGSKLFPVVALDTALPQTLTVTGAFLTVAGACSLFAPFFPPPSRRLSLLFFRCLFALSYILCFVFSAVHQGHGGEFAERDVRGTASTRGELARSRAYILVQLNNYLVSHQRCEIDCLLALSRPIFDNGEVVANANAVDDAEKEGRG